MTSDWLPLCFITGCVSLQGEFPIKNRLLHHSKYHAQLISLIFLSLLIFLSNQTKELKGLLELAFSTAGGRRLLLLLFQTAVLACLWIEKQNPDKQANKNYTLDSQMSYHTVFSHVSASVCFWSSISLVLCFESVCVCVCVGGYNVWFTSLFSLANFTTSSHTYERNNVSYECQSIYVYYDWQGYRYAE